METTKQKEQEASEMQRRVLSGFECRLGTVELDHQTEGLVGPKDAWLLSWVRLPIPWGLTHIFTL